MSANLKWFHRFLVAVVTVGMLLFSLPVGAAFAGSGDEDDKTEFVADGPTTIIEWAAPKSDQPSVAAAAPCTVFPRIHWWRNSDEGRGKVQVHAIKGGDCQPEVTWNLSADFGGHSLSGGAQLTKEDNKLHDPVFWSDFTPGNHLIFTWSLKDGTPLSGQTYEIPARGQVRLGVEPNPANGCQARINYIVDPLIRVWVDNNPPLEWLLQQDEGVSPWFDLPSDKEVVHIKAVAYARPPYDDTTIGGSIEVDFQNGACYQPPQPESVVAFDCTQVHYDIINAPREVEQLTGSARLSGPNGAAYDVSLSFAGWDGRTAKFVGSLPGGLANGHYSISAQVGSMPAATSESDLQCQTPQTPESSVEFDCLRILYLVKNAPENAAQLGGNARVTGPGGFFHVALSFAGSDGSTAKYEGLMPDGLLNGHYTIATFVNGLPEATLEKDLTCEEPVAPTSSVSFDCSQVTYKVENAPQAAPLFASAHISGPDGAAYDVSLSLQGFDGTTAVYSGAMPDNLPNGHYTVSASGDNLPGATADGDLTCQAVPSRGSWTFTPTCEKLTASATNGELHLVVDAQGVSGSRTINIDLSAGQSRTYDLDLRGGARITWRGSFTHDDGTVEDVNGAVNLSCKEASVEFKDWRDCRSRFVDYRIHNGELGRLSIFIVTGEDADGQPIIETLIRAVKNYDELTEDEKRNFTPYRDAQGIVVIPHAFDGGKWMREQLYVGARVIEDGTGERKEFTWTLRAITDEDLKGCAPSQALFICGKLFYVLDWADPNRNYAAGAYGAVRFSNGDQRWTYFQYSHSEPMPLTAAELAQLQADGKPQPLRVFFVSDQFSLPAGVTAATIEHGFVDGLPISATAVQIVPCEELPPPPVEEKEPICVDWVDGKPVYVEFVVGSEEHARAKSRERDVCRERAAEPPSELAQSQQQVDAQAAHAHVTIGGVVDTSVRWAGENGELPSSSAGQLPWHRDNVVISCHVRGPCANLEKAVVGDRIVYEDYAAGKRYIYSATRSQRIAYASEEYRNPSSLNSVFVAYTCHQPTVNPRSGQLDSDFAWMISADLVEVQDI